MEQRSAELDQYSVSNPVSLYGRFSLAGNPKVRCAVSLSESDLTIQRLTSSPAPPKKLVLSLNDCVGCRAYRADDAADPAAYLAADFYPLRRRWASSGATRQRVEQCFRLAALQESRANLEEAEKWARAVRERSSRLQLSRNGPLTSQLPRPCRLMLLLNPQSGRGAALSRYQNHIQPMMSRAGVQHSLVLTERQNHARELLREVDLSLWDAVVIMSGDGLLFEVINGLLERADWETAIQTPLGVLPAGSGNGLAASIHHYSGAAPAGSEELLLSCGFLLCRGLVSPMDLVSVHLTCSPRVFSFLSLAWGFVADVDIESEKYRPVGAARFTVGTLVRLVSLRVYKGRLAYLPVAEDQKTKENLRKTTKSSQKVSTSNNSLQEARTESSTSPLVHRSVTGPPDSLLPPLDQPLSPDWVVAQDQDFVLVLAIYQSHLAEDLMAAPGSKLEDGIIHLFYVRAGISRSALLKLFLLMQKGAHLAANCPHLVYRKVQALRLEPSSPKGVVTVDGELVEFGPLQAQVHRGLASVITG